MPEDMLQVSAGAWDGDGSGPVITVSGQADVTTIGPLRELVTAQLSRGIRYLTIDAAGLTVADSMALRIFVLAALTLKDRGGGLVLLHPQPPVARMLALTGADMVITVRGAADMTPSPAEAQHPAVSQPGPASDRVTSE